MFSAPDRLAPGNEDTGVCLFPPLLAAALTLVLPACSGGGSNEESDGDNGGDRLTAPAAPSGLSAASQDGSIALEWDAVSQADTYRVYRSTSSGVEASGSPLNTGISSADDVDESAAIR
ncbi:hypothetical protein GGP50_001776 [Salinibacter ruber]|nr:hypothetical protein [Salinibacter ruber]